MRRRVFAGCDLFRLFTGFHLSAPLATGRGFTDTAIPMEAYGPANGVLVAPGKRVQDRESRGAVFFASALVHFIRRAVSICRGTCFRRRRNFRRRANAQWPFSRQTGGKNANSGRFIEN